MNEKFREWYLTVNIAPQEGQIKKRISAIEAFGKNINKIKVLNLIKLYYGGDLDKDSKADFTNCFIATDETFLPKNENEIKMLAGATLVYLAENRTGIDSLVELFSIAINRFRSPSILEEIYQAILEQYFKDSVNLRDFELKPFEIEKSAIEEFIKYTSENGLDSEASEKLCEALAVLQKGQQSLVRRMKDNEEQTSIYREDSQILWWLMSEHCSTLDKSIKCLDKISACLLLGKEASDIIDNFPGPSAIQAVLNKMLGNCKGKSEQITIAQAISYLSEDCKEQLTSMANDFSFIELLPLTSAIIRSKNTVSIDEWYPKFKREILISDDDYKLLPQEFAWQMYIECLALKCYRQYR